MTQLSSSTLSYAQIYRKLSAFFADLSTGVYSSSEEKLEEYTKVLSDLQASLGKPMVKVDPYIDGEPPFSDKFNSFSAALVDDINIIGTEIDYLGAKLINVFNLFSSEIENEKTYTERISSKIKILRMYNRSPSEDLYYFGDSFENSDRIDVSKIKKNSIPLVKNSSATYPILDTKIWQPNVIKIEGSNGFSGNSHQVVKAQSQEGNSQNEFVFKRMQGINVQRNIIDQSPLTVYEYEVLDVDKTSLNGNELVSDNEFKYVAGPKSRENVAQGDLVDWSSYPVDNDLFMKATLQSNLATLANCVEIVPYFDSMDYVTVESVRVFNKSGFFEEILDAPIYIGSSMYPVNLDVSKNYFYNKANLKFEERNLSKIEIYFRQKEYKNVEISHCYWVPNYSENYTGDSPFAGLGRFNPFALNPDLYDVSFDYRELLPSYDNPVEFKTSDTYVKNVDVNLTPTPVTYENYIITLYGKLNVRNKYLFQNWYEDEDGDGNTIRKPAFSSRDLSGTGRTGLSYYASPEDAQRDIDELISYFRQYGAHPSEYDQDEVLINYYSDDVKYNDGLDVFETFDISEISAIKYEKTVTSSSRKYSVPLTQARQILPAKRKVIGLRDITVTHETYASNFEIVSTPYDFSDALDSVMLSVDVDDIENSNLNYYISADNGDSWIAISPIQLDFSSVPEVLSFNNNVNEISKLPGVGYLNYPSVPQSVKSILVKIVSSKGTNVNSSPVLRGYQLIAKVKR